MYTKRIEPLQQTRQGRPTRYSVPQRTGENRNEAILQGKPDTHTHTTRSSKLQLGVAERTGHRTAILAAPHLALTRYGLPPVPLTTTSTSKPPTYNPHRIRPTNIPTPTSIQSCRARHRLYAWPHRCCHCRRVLPFTESPVSLRARRRWPR